VENDGIACVKGGVWLHCGVVGGVSVVVHVFHVVSRQSKADMNILVVSRGDGRCCSSRVIAVCCYFDFDLRVVVLFEERRWSGAGCLLLGVSVEIYVGIGTSIRLKAKTEGAPLLSLTEQRSKKIWLSEVNDG
jgi:hypothetical protein